MIFAAAIKWDGVVFYLPQPARHHTIIRVYGKRRFSKMIEGFLDTNEGFVDRKRAARIAIVEGQIEKTKFQPNTLFSADLW